MHFNLIKHYMKLLCLTFLKPNTVVMPGTCIRVSTGGVIPEGADAVVQVEDTHVCQSSEVINYIYIIKLLL